MWQSLNVWEQHLQIKTALMKELKAIKSCGMLFFLVNNLSYVMSATYIKDETLYNS